jgi:hypothetical protein
MRQQAIYHSEDSRWYRQGEEPWRVRIVKMNEPIMPLFSVVADTCLEAFESLYNIAAPIPTPEHAPHREPMLP